MTTHRLVPRPPSIDAYMRLRSDSGLTPKNRKQAEAAIANSWSFCHVRDGSGEAVAMGRTIGDGGWYFHIADMATLPTHQRQGLGRQVLQWLIDDIRNRAPQDPYITLVADPPGQPLYRGLGFVPTDPSISMVLENT